MKVTPELIQEIRSKNPIVDVVKEYGVQIRYDGKACCPFHEEDTPSFMVYEDSGSYHCYGCGAGTKGKTLRLKDGDTVVDAGSDVIAFIQNIEKMNFIDACKHLMRRANIPIPDDKVNVALEKAKDAVTDRNRRYYQELVKRPDLLQYLYDRGLTQDDIKKWRLGFVHENDKTIKESLRGRLVFAIMEEHYQPDKAKTIAMAYRRLNDNEKSAKYINDANSNIYNKSEVLYGMNYAAPNIRKKRYAIAVEGYVDVILLHQVGLDNAVATCGTSFTEEQIKKLRKYTDQLFLWYDGDEAGQNATMRALPDLLKEGFTVMLIDSRGEDPADVAKRLIQQYGPGKQAYDAMVQFVKQHARPAVQVLIDMAVSQFESIINQERVKVLTKILPVLDAIQKPAEKMNYTAVLQQKLRLY